MVGLLTPEAHREPRESDPEIADGSEFVTEYGLATAMKLAADRAACAVRRLCAPCPGNQDWPRIAKEVVEARRLYDSRGWIDDPASFHAGPPAIREPKLVGARSRGRAFIHMQFRSGYAPHMGEPGRDRWLEHAANRTAHAWILRHDDARPRPWMICIHGYGMGFPFLDFAAFPTRKLYERLGFNVVFPVLPMHGPRRVGLQSGDRFLDGDCLDTIHAEAQSVWELRRILSWIRSQSPTAVGVYGLSLGGYNAALLAELESDLSCVVAGIPAVDFLRLGRMHTPARSIACAERCGVEWPLMADILRVVSPLAMPARVARERLFIFGGSADLVVPAEQPRELWEHWKKPRIAWYPGGHFSFRWEPVVRRLLREALETSMPGAITSSVAA